MFLFNTPEKSVCFYALFTITVTNIVNIFLCTVIYRVGNKDMVQVDVILAQTSLLAHILQIKKTSLTL